MARPRTGPRRITLTITVQEGALIREALDALQRQYMRAYGVRPLPPAGPGQPPRWSIENMNDAAAFAASVADLEALRNALPPPPGLPGGEASVSAKRRAP